MAEGDRVTEIAGRVAAASEGPWVLGDQREHHLSRGSSETKQDVWGPDVEASPADADFIAHSRSDVEYLLDRLRTAEAVITEAPHRFNCNKLHTYDGACDCWKSTYQAGVE